MKVYYDKGGKEGQTSSFKVENTQTIKDAVYFLSHIKTAGEKISWEYPLSSLENGRGMFKSSVHFNSFNSNIPSLIDGDSMFESTQIQSFSGDLSSLVVGKRMFYNSPNLVSFNSLLSSLKSANEMFTDARLNKISLENIADTLNDIYHLDKNNDEDWSYELLGKTEIIPHEERGNIDISVDETISDNIVTNLGVWITNKGWNVKINEQQYDTLFVEYDDYGNVIDANLKYLKDGYYLFENQSFDSFSYDLSSLTSGYSMFYNCSNLTTFTSDLSSLWDGSHMFSVCFELTSFASDLSSLTEGFGMFLMCSNLTSFASDLSSLTSGYQMFSGCKLDEESVRHIANTINDVSELNLGFQSKISIGHDTNIPEISIIECGNKMLKKGWDVYFNDVKYRFKHTYDVSEDNGYCPDGGLWNDEVYIPNDLVITRITVEGEMLNDE